MDNGITNGVAYYYVVTAMNVLGTESANSGEVAVTPSSLVSTNIAFAVVGGQSLQISWPGDHTGWTLQVQINEMSTGLGTNWQNIVGSTETNQVVIPLDPGNGTVFYRLMHP